MIEENGVNHRKVILLHMTKLDGLRGIANITAQNKKMCIFNFCTMLKT